MRGRNTLVLNHDCLVEAVQLWLDVQYKRGQAPTVERVKSRSEYSAEAGRQVDMFETTLSDPRPLSVPARIVAPIGPPPNEEESSDEGAEGDLDGLGVLGTSSPELGTPVTWMEEQIHQAVERPEVVRRRRGT